VMPVAGQDAFLDTAAFQREAHMGAAIVQGKDLPTLMYQEYRAMAAVHNKPPLSFQFFEAARMHEIRGRSIHRRLIDKRPAAAPFSKGLPRMSIQPPMYPSGR
jgi:hypothetical protein